MSRRRLGAATALLAAGPLALTATAPAHAEAPDPVTVALDWQATAIATVPFSPAKGLYLGFTSKAVDKAVAASLRREQSSEAAAIAQAAHDVLVEYFPAAGPTLDDRLAQTLATVPDGPAEDRGVSVGADVAAGIIDWRTDDGRNDPSIAFSKTPGIGVWQDARGMATPWLGFVDRVVGAEPVKVDGPDPVGSAAYRADPTEVAATGRTGADPEKAATATFFNVDAFSLYRAALITHLRSSPVDLRATTSLFADLDLATAEAFRQTWRLKLEVGFWRPVVAVAADDGDPLTEPVARWTSVLPLPPYPEYPSGHGTITSAFAETVRCHLGDVSLTLNGAGGSRTYASLTALEDAAFLSRIWGGIHFRDAMEDSFLIGHTVARQVCG